MPIALLLAMQAAGMVYDWYGNQKQKEAGRMGLAVEKAGIESNIELTRLDAEDATLNAMKKLRQNLGSQAALMAARGTAGNAGTALMFRADAESKFGSDERTRKINQLGREAQLRAGSVIADLHQTVGESQMDSALAKRFFNQLPVASIGKIGSSFAGSSASSKGSYGLTPL